MIVDKKIKYNSEETTPHIVVVKSQSEFRLEVELILIEDWTHQEPYVAGSNEEIDGVYVKDKALDAYISKSKSAINHGAVISRLQHFCEERKRKDKFTFTKLYEELRDGGVRHDDLGAEIRPTIVDWAEKKGWRVKGKTIHCGYQTTKEKNIAELESQRELGRQTISKIIVKIESFAMEILFERMKGANPFWNERADNPSIEWRHDYSLIKYSQHRSAKFLEACKEVSKKKCWAEVMEDLKKERFNFSLSWKRKYITFPEALDKALNFLSIPLFREWYPGVEKELKKIKKLL
tara:strand:+ start:2567 stop:3442 length:876 start_codon:yes stop_codon:yes gene_type:complete